MPHLSRRHPCLCSSPLSLSPLSVLEPGFAGGRLPAENCQQHAFAPWHPGTPPSPLPPPEGEESPLFCPVTFQGRLWSSWAQERIALFFQVKELGAPSAASQQVPLLSHPQRAGSWRPYLWISCQSSCVTGFNITGVSRALTRQLFRKSWCVRVFLPAVCGESPRQFLFQGRRERSRSLSL